MWVTLSKGKREEEEKVGEECMYVVCVSVGTVCAYKLV